MASTVTGENGVNATFLQANCQRSHGVMCDLSQYVLEKAIQLCLFQEPYVYRDKVCGLPAGTRVFMSELGSAAVGVFDKSYECLLIEECKFKDGVCVWIKGEVGEMIVVSLYFKPKEGVEECLEYLDKVRSMAAGKRVLVGMDANAASDLWFSKSMGRAWNSMKRGERIVEWIDRRIDVSVLNVPSEAYTFSGAGGESDIDVTLFIGDANDCEFQWRVLDNVGVSDHNPIEIRLHVGNGQVGESSGKVKKWNARNCNWRKYVSHIESSALEFGYKVFQELMLEDKVEVLYNWIENANDECMKRVTRVKSRKGVAWWSKELADKRKEVAAKRRRYQRERKRTGDQERIKWNEWKTCMQEYKGMIKEAKDEDWKRFVGTEGKDPWGKVYKLCMGKTDGRCIAGLKTDNGWTRTWLESANVLLNEFFPSDDGIPIPDDNLYGREAAWVFTMEEVEYAVSRMSMNKAPGMDGITNEMIRRVWLAIPLFMRSLYNSCLEEGIFPEPWKEARVVVLLKGTDKNRAEPRSYRPISLLSGLGKILERMLVERLLENTEGKWNECQYGFTKGKCTEDAWMKLKAMVNESKSKHVIGIFVDFKGAFDFLLWRVAIGKLKEAGCTDREMRLWRNYFSERKVWMCNGMEETSKDAKRGCPQGSIAGPVIWNLCMNELLNWLTDRNTKVVAYADDLTIIVEAETRIEIERSAGEIMKVVYAWGERAGVDVSESKTVCMVLKGGLDMINRIVHVNLDGNDDRRIKFVNSVKYLGVNMGTNMNFRVHVNGLRKRVTGIIGRLRRVLRKDWGLRRASIRVIVQGMVVPAIMYGASVWYELVRLKGIREELIRCQRVVLYACTRVCRTASTEAMQIIFGSLPWDIECVKQACMYKTRKGMHKSDIDLVTNEEIRTLNVYEAKELVEKRAYEKWQKRWDESGNGRVTYEWIKEVRFASQTKLFDPGLQVCYVLTGHGSLNSLLYSRNLTESPKCPCEHEKEDWVHVLCECDMYEAFRDLDGMNVVKLNNKWDVSRVLSSRESYETMRAFVERAFKMRSSIISRMRNE